MQSSQSENKALAIVLGLTMLVGLQLNQPALLVFSIVFHWQRSIQCARELRPGQELHIPVLVQRERETYLFRPFRAL